MKILEENRQFFVPNMKKFNCHRQIQTTGVVGSLADGELCLFPQKSVFEEHLLRTIERHLLVVDCCTTQRELPTPTGFYCNHLYLKSPQ